MPKRYHVHTDGILDAYIYYSDRNCRLGPYCSSYNCETFRTLDVAKDFLIKKISQDIDLLREERRKIKAITKKTLMKKWGNE